MQTLEAEKEEFKNTIQEAEIKIRERQDELDGREVELDQRKEAYDDFDLKMLGIKMNEEVWQKRRDIEVDNLVEEVKKIREKERELKRKEDRLMKWEQELKKNKDETFGGTQKTEKENKFLLLEEQLIDNSFNLNDKSLLPLSSARTLNMHETMDGRVNDTKDYF